MWLSTWAITILGALTFVSGLFKPLEDPSASDKYSISYVNPDYWQVAIKNNATALMEGSILQMSDGLSCYVQRQGPNDTLRMKKRHAGMEFEKMLQENLERGIDLIIANIKECIMFMSGYWTYEYCPQKSLSQYHGNLKTTPLHFILGKPKKSGQDREFRLLYNDFDYYVSEIMDSGDICDLTGNPRVVEIRYVCGSAADSAVIQWIKEVKTCYYEIQIAVPKLCELELLSTNEEKKMSKPVLCVDDKSSGGIIDLLGKYRPTFVGNDFYLLQPQVGSTEEQRKILLYSGDHIIKDGFVDNDAEFYKSIGNAFRRMLYQQLLMPPGGLIYTPGDEISWISDIVDLNGTYLTTLQFNLSATSMADISLSNNTIFPKSGNLLSYRRRNSEHEINDSSRLKNSYVDSQIQKLKSLKDTGGDVKLLVMDGTSKGSKFLVKSDSEGLFEETLSSEQIDSILKEQDEPTQLDAIDELAKYFNMLYEQNDEPEYTWRHPDDKPRQPGTINALEKEQQFGLVEQSQDSDAQYDTALENVRQENHEFENETNKGEEDGDNDIRDPGRHLHDEF